MKTWMRSFFLLAALLGSPVFLTGCDSDSDAENAVEDAADSVGDTVDDAADDIEDAADDLTN